MMEVNLIELFKAIFLGIVEGVTEWLPISSTGHMILVDAFLPLSMSQAFKDMFLVVVQLGAILAVVVFYWNQFIPFSVKGGLAIKKDIMSMWLKIIVACIPAGVYAVTLDDKLNSLFYNYQTVAIMLILVGILFIVAENYNKGKKPKITEISNISYRTALIIGVFQLIAAVFPGTSRSGATIVGGLLIGVSRTVAAELITLILGMAVAFGISLLTIRFLMSYVKKHDFKVFGWYRIILGIIVLLIYL